MDALEKKSLSQTGKGKHVSLASTGRTEKGPPLSAYRYFVEVVVFRSECYDTSGNVVVAFSDSRVTGPNVFFHLLTTCSRALLEKLTGSQLAKKFPAFYGTRRFIATCPYLQSDQSSLCPRIPLPEDPS
jgi:hypothetical protein